MRRKSKRERRKTFLKNSFKKGFLFLAFYALKQYM